MVQPNGPVFDTDETQQYPAPELTMEEVWQPPEIESEPGLGKANEPEKTKKTEKTEEPKKPDPSLAKATLEDHTQRIPVS